MCYKTNVFHSDSICGETGSWESSQVRAIHLAGQYACPYIFREKILLAIQFPGELVIRLCADTNLWLLSSAKGGDYLVIHSKG